ncbi:MAG: type II toxin-antitoxin system HicA family toxin [candidate division WOR-3 bacterium]
MSPKLPVLSPKDVIRVLLKAGFYVHHQTGSHVQLKHSTRAELRLTVPFHNRDLPKAVLRSIIRQAGLSVDEFIDLLR